MRKPYSEACEENKRPILSVIAPLLDSARTLLEIGSGTGQHAVFFAAAMPQLRWQCSDVLENLPGIRAWLSESDLPNLPQPLALDVASQWPAGPFDACFSANTAHIMSEPRVAAMLSGVGRVLAPGGRFALYGPFSHGGRHTSESNARFDAWLKARDPRMGVRDIDDLVAIADAAGMDLVDSVEMPANNLILVWEKPVASSEGRGVDG